MAQLGHDIDGDAGPRECHTETDCMAEVTGLEPRRAKERKFP